MTDNIIKFRPKKYGVDYHREEMERCDAEYIRPLLSDGIAWLTTKGALYTEFDEATGRWVHKWREELLQVAEAIRGRTDDVVKPPSQHAYCCSILDKALNQLRAEGFEEINLQCAVAEIYDEMFGGDDEGPRHERRHAHRRGQARSEIHISSPRIR